MKIARNIFITAVVFLVMAACYLYIDYRLIKVEKSIADEFEKRVMSAIKAGDNIDLKEVTPFAWDTFYYFHAYTPPDSMYKKQEQDGRITVPFLVICYSMILRKKC